MLRDKIFTALAVVSIFGLAACASDSSRQLPDSLMGDWKQVDNSGGYVAYAEVAASSIQVNLVSRDGDSSIYWMGTFDGERETDENFMYVSKADQDALAFSMMGSTDANKKFVYEDGRIAYKFTMMGTTYTVELAKQK